jgi:hypothetical protein
MDEAAVWNPMEQQFVAPCRHCGTPKRIDTWCASPECAERVAQAQQEEHLQRQQFRADG